MQAMLAQYPIIPIEPDKDGLASQRQRQMYTNREKEIVFTFFGLKNVYTFNMFIDTVSS